MAIDWTTTLRLALALPGVVQGAEPRRVRRPRSVAQERGDLEEEAGGDPREVAAQRPPQEREGAEPNASLTPPSAQPLEHLDGRAGAGVITIRRPVLVEQRPPPVLDPRAKGAPRGLEIYALRERRPGHPRRGPELGERGRRSPPQPARPLCACPSPVHTVIMTEAPSRRTPRDRAARFAAQTNGTLAAAQARRSASSANPSAHRRVDSCAAIAPSTRSTRPAASLNVAL